MTQYFKATALTQNPSGGGVAYCLCGAPIDRNSNFRRHVQVRGVAVNTVRDTGTCSEECLDAWWSDHEVYEHLIEPVYQKQYLYEHDALGNILYETEDDAILRWRARELAEAKAKYDVVFQGNGVILVGADSISGASLVLNNGLPAFNVAPGELVPIILGEEFVLGADGERVHSPLPEDPAIEMLIHDFVAKKRDSLVQLMPIHVFADHHDCNQWWNTPETEDEAAMRSSAKAGLPHQVDEVLSVKAQDILSAQKR